MTMTVEHPPAASTIQTASGIYFDLLEPDTSMVDIRDIAHALARICRFTGHVRRHYSVAEHSLHASHWVPAPWAFAALMHDAHEAYVGDVAAPLKRLIPDYRRIEQRVEAVVRERFGLPPVFPHCVKQADLQMLATERAQLMPHDTLYWGLLEGVQPLTIDLEHGHSIDEIEHAFLERFHQLWPQSGPLE